MSPTEQHALILPVKQGNFVLSTRPIPSPKAGEILVKVKAISLNPIDSKIQSTGIMVEKYPAVLGNDVAGEVASLGEGVKSFSKGDRVFFQAVPPIGPDYGGYQDYALGLAETVAKKYTYSQAATVPLTLTTAAVGLFADAPSGAGLNPTWDPKVRHVGKSALIIGGGSSVGMNAPKITRSSTTIIAYASGTHTEYLKSLGATTVIDRNKVPASDLTTVNIVYDAVFSPEGQAAGYAALVDNGHLLSVRATPDAYVPTDLDYVRGRKVTSVIGSPHMPNNRVFGKILYEKLGGLLKNGAIVSRLITPLARLGLKSFPAGWKALRWAC
ncbi:GroES-like protein [Gymnopus androsaceus JB14]|uniref:GroES-like protein n=1 Tax=Gymnopus androsaceus JB14 TaxID=1447944 RepID=A0A6A4I224_9AGAR|nr:GroES-like protein [Gymnopus androsaceus JB14]